MNLRPSGYEPDELPGCSTPRHAVVSCEAKRPGNDLLFHTLRCSTISATELHVRVRNGIGWYICAIITRPFSLTALKRKIIQIITYDYVIVIKTIRFLLS